MEIYIFIYTSALFPTSNFLHSHDSKHHCFTMDSIDLGRYKRMIQYLWDAEPKNDQGAGSRIWCLGKEYVTPDKDEFPADNNINSPSNADDSSIAEAPGCPTAPSVLANISSTDSLSSIIYW